MKRTKLVAILLCILMVLSVLTACTSKEDKALAEKNETTPVVIGVSRDSVQGSGDAYYCWQGSYVWESLTMNKGGEIISWLATGWDHNDDCTEWTITLRQGVTFTDGEPFNAEAVLANINRWTHGIKSTYTTLSVAKTFPNLESMEATDEYTIVFKFSKPITVLEYNLADYGSPMFSPKCFDAETGVIGDYAVGTGPYVIVDHVEGQYVNLERNENYWGTKGIVKNITLKCITDAETRYSALVSDEVQGLADNGAINMQQAYDLCQARPDDFAMDKTLSHMSEFMIFNYNNEYLQDIRIREALSISLDRELINTALYSGLVTPGYSFLSNQSIFHYDVEGEYNLDKAISLAKEALGDNRIELNMIINSKKANEYNLKAVAEYCKAEWAKLGIDLNISILESAQYTQRQKDGDYDMWLVTAGLNNADPCSTFTQYYSSTGSTNKNYNCGYSNPELDALLAEIPTIPSKEERAAKYVIVQQMLYDDFAGITLNYQVNVNIHSTAIEGYAGQTIGVNLPGIHWVK